MNTELHGARMRTGVRGAPRHTGIMHHTKLCEACGDVFAKPATTPWNRWHKRRFCSKECWWKVRPNWNRYADA